MALISVSGKIGSGKDFAAKLIQEIDPNSGWKIVKWAEPLKEMASMLSGVPRDLWEDQDFKRLKMTSEWGDMTYREFLQKLGTDAIRDNLHKNAWVNAVMKDYRPVCKHCGMLKGHKMSCWSYKSGVECEYEMPHWLMTDTRFPNEADAVKRAGGITLKIIRDCPSCGEPEYHKLDCPKRISKENMHSSETSLDSYTFDYTIHNTGDDLKSKLIKFLEYARNKENHKKRV